MQGRIGGKLKTYNLNSFAKVLVFSLYLFFIDKDRIFFLSVFISVRILTMFRLYKKFAWWSTCIISMYGSETLVFLSPDR